MDQSRLALPENRGVFVHPLNRRTASSQNLKFIDGSSHKRSYSKVATPPIPLDLHSPSESSEEEVLDPTERVNKSIDHGIIKEHDCGCSNKPIARRNIFVSPDQKKK